MRTRSLRKQQGPDWVKVAFDCQARVNRTRGQNNLSKNLLAKEYGTSSSTIRRLVDIADTILMLKGEGRGGEATYLEAVLQRTSVSTAYDACVAVAKGFYVPNLSSAEAATVSNTKEPIPLRGNQPVTLPNIATVGLPARPQLTRNLRLRVTAVARSIGELEDMRSPKGMYSPVQRMPVDTARQYLRDITYQIDTLKGWQAALAAVIEKDDTAYDSTSADAEGTQSY